MSNFYGLVLGILAVWRLTHLLNAEDGPLDVFVRLRQRVGDGFFGQLLDCFYCLSIWIAAPIALWVGHGWGERLLLIPALSGAAILLERLSAPVAPIPPAIPPMPSPVPYPMPYYEEAPPNDQKEP